MFRLGDLNKTVHNQFGLIDIIFLAVHRNQELFIAACAFHTFQ